eukprot:CAMPEP_0206015606 /NCGR_PEP_ID=MMETSP1464-20131121/20639_1 /ASSEMBLY_ACC=CAM_ASM_001124 /TAXON_ID=119497 /ORGANISM="Exanthemachrysis gayraliae, Strain RCC1523" /LENGTH=85 /DNA_ID=CAMNT_0053389403 /DNA_START=222 /DNA_END=475 /DNA_ORIENTATION=-
MSRAPAPVHLWLESRGPGGARESDAPRQERWSGVCAIAAAAPVGPPLPALKAQLRRGRTDLSQACGPQRARGGVVGRCGPSARAA